ncbi:hypothetical protein CBA19CS42_27460 [Caballeronia novacaledonica]|jgi:hypothetical protein|uniref:Uncharacterized protein n=1 Tax=Caballeronia novacaledonica TaxID=1544861 RepID=A0AA37IEF9_9BURK|nr:hypothetical protein CBA19CS42_27460 [Caballeronia novacaledonica]
MTTLATRRRWRHKASFWRRVSLVIELIVGRKTA